LHFCISCLTLKLLVLCKQFSKFDPWRKGVAMRKLVLQMQISVDGRVASDEGEPWQVWGWGNEWPWDESLKRDFNATLATVGCILLSRPMV